MPNQEQFSDPAFPAHLKIKAQIVDEELQKEFESHPKRPIYPVRPDQASPHLEPVVIAGVAFYLDHENQMVIPVDPS